MLRRLMLPFGLAFLIPLCLTRLPYLALGLWNRTMGGWVMVFYCYPGSVRHARRYSMLGLRHVFRWYPVPIGVLHQNGEWGIVLASSASEDDFTDPANAPAFLRLQRRIGRIAKITGAENVHLAGILPSLIGSDAAIKLAQTRPQVVRAITQAVSEVMQDHLPPSTRDVIVLGGAGFIGRETVTTLEAAGYICHVVDPRTGQTDLPVSLRNQSALLLDVARKGAITPLIEQMWPGLVVLNEVFPAPSPKLAAKLHQKGVPILHLAGVTGRVMPTLPYGYEGAVPCCAARPKEGPLQVVIRDMSVPIAASRPIKAQVPDTDTSDHIKA